MRDVAAAGHAWRQTELSTRRTGALMKPAAELHEDVTRELTWDPQVAGPEAIAVAVKDGAVALEGEVEYDYQGRETDKAVRDGRGVTGIIGFIVFVRGVRELALAPSQEPFALTVTRSVNSVLFVVVVLELVRTIVARLEGGGFQLQPFLVIGIISATRDILTVGAELSLVGRRLPLAPAMMELGVNAGVAVALSVALVLVRRFARLDRA